MLDLRRLASQRHAPNTACILHAPGFEMPVVLLFRRSSRIPGSGGRAKGKVLNGMGLEDRARALERSAHSNTEEENQKGVYVI